MPAEVGLASRRSADRQETVQAGGRTLLIAGAAVAAVAAVVYLVALATHPMDAMLKGFDLQVYLGGARQALHHSHSLYSWEFEKHPGIQFTYTPFAALAFAAGLALPFTGLMAIVTVVLLFCLVATIWIAFRQLGWEKTSRLGATLLLSGLLLWTRPVQRAPYLSQAGGAGKAPRPASRRASSWYRSCSSPTCCSPGGSGRPRWRPGRSWSRS